LISDLQAYKVKIMKKFACLLIIFFSYNNSSLAYIPDGCYGTDPYGYCWNVSFSASDCDGYNPSSRVGIFMSTACQYVNDVEQIAVNNYNSYLTAADQRDYCYNGWTQCTNSLNSATSTALSLDKSVKSQAALIKKLRKACGSKCKRIR
jgi:hypothetical protein